MLASIPAATVLGVEGRPVVVEVHVSTGLPGFSIVGLPDAACRESRDRVRAALLSSGLGWPLRRVTVNLAPSEPRKAGAGLDLAIAVGLLVATGELDARAIGSCGFLGELGLDGSLRPVRGVLALVEATRADAVVVPASSAAEARLVPGRKVLSGRSLREVLEALSGSVPWPPASVEPRLAAPSEVPPDLAEVRGQLVARQALEVAAAGGHHLLLVGPPGAGKTMLARCLPGILPPLRPAESLETTRVHSAAGLTLPAGVLVTHPPFRAPHHTATAPALLGGGSGWVRPGEASLATNGVLFLDELGEFSPGVLEALRQPIEEGVVRVARARSVTALPARFLLVAAMNPCPCGEGTTSGSCRCSTAMRQRYGRRLSGPLLDRLDLQVVVERPPAADLFSTAGGEASGTVAERVLAARRRSLSRGVRANAEIPAALLDEIAPLSPAARALLSVRLSRGELSARGLARARRVARTVADLAGAGEIVEDAHVALALELRAGRELLLGTAA